MLNCYVVELFIRWNRVDQAQDMCMVGKYEFSTRVDAGVNYFGGEVTANSMVILEQSKKEHGGLSSYPE